jgi:hypothetical protein
MRGKKLQALGLFGGGLATAATIVLYARGYTREAAAIAVFTALLGATMGAARVLSPTTGA